MGQTLSRQSLSLQEQAETETPAGNPLPHIIHAQLSSEQLGKRRVICVGDVHGCVDELKTLLRKCQYRKERDLLVFNGDIVNKGPKSVQTIDLIQSMDAVVVRGNQDDKALAAYVQWKNGKALEEPMKWLEDLGDTRAEWLRQLPFSLSIPSLDFLVVHAGLIPGIPLKQQSLKTLTELRVLPESLSTHSTDEQVTDCAPDKPHDAGNMNVLPNKLHPSDAQPQVPWGSRWGGPQHVIFGHDAGRKLQTWPCATGLDTGCCYGNQLTALIIPHQEAALCREGASPSKHVPSLSDVDACLVLVPALKAYSKKK
ncbi:hypothetical protein ABBQ32_000890 [Trebouxia sp. C0010 RCD-2024]